VFIEDTLYPLLDLLPWNGRGGLGHQCAIHAENGKDGLELILNEEPIAAVIDYHLPNLSGIEICREIRKIHELDHVQLLIFTADDSPDIRAQAMAIGANEVVVKSSDSADIIDRVLHHLNQPRPH
jgi:DNA-binding response OmpR family regulator